MCALALALIAPVAAAAPATTSGEIAVANLRHQVAQAREPTSRIELLLLLSRFLGDHDALEEAVALAETLPADGASLLARARARAHVHRFAEALADLHAASRAGASMRQVEAQRASILVATGRAAEALPVLRAEVEAGPGFASRSALAAAYAELGRHADADREYRAALDTLRTTSPFPHAWVHFALGVMWSEQAGDARRGEAGYARALELLPGFAPARIHQAELELARGELQSAQERIESLALDAGEPEALALMGEIRRRRGDEAGAAHARDAARARYEDLLRRQPLAFADHAAEFHLGHGADPQRACHWATVNRANRPTARARELESRACGAGDALSPNHPARSRAGSGSRAWQGVRFPPAPRRATRIPAARGRKR